MGNKQQKHIFCCKLHWFHILFNMTMTMTMLFYSQRAQTGVWAPFDLFSSFSATTSFGFGFAVGGVVGSASGTFVTSVSGSFTRVSHCQSWTALLIHPFIQRGVKNALKINIYLWFDDRIDIASRALRYVLDKQWDGLSSHVTICFLVQFRLVGTSAKRLLGSSRLYPGLPGASPASREKFNFSKNKQILCEKLITIRECVQLLINV